MQSCGPYLKYIKKALGNFPIYEYKENTRIVGYSEADWAGSLSNRGSTSGYCVLLGGNLISQESKNKMLWQGQVQKQNSRQ